MEHFIQGRIMKSRQNHEVMKDQKTIKRIVGESDTMKIRNERNHE